MVVVNSSIIDEPIRRRRNRLVHGPTIVLCAAATAATSSSLSKASAATSSSTGRPHRHIPASSLLVPAAGASIGTPLNLHTILDVRGGAESSEKEEDGTTSHDPHNNKSRKKKTTKRGSKPSKETDDLSSKPHDNASHNTKKSSIHHPPPPNKIVQDILQQDDYYEILGLSHEQVKHAKDPLHTVTKAYRRRCVHTHPDKTGGDRRAFDKVAEAYHVLSDDTQRKMYDKYGKQGLHPNHPGSSSFPFGTTNLSAEDLFRSFFEGAGSPFRSQQAQQRPVSRNRTTRYQLEVSLMDLYNGMTKTIRVAPPPEPMSNLFRQPSSPSTSRKPKSVQVHVPRGSVDGAHIVLSGEVDFDPTQPPADLVFVIRQIPHPIFQRKGYDLILTLTVSLSEALCGYTKTIKHLNGTNLRVSYGTGTDTTSSIIQTGDVHVLKAHGMPKDETGRTFGDLYIVYKVEWPKNLSASSQQPQQSALTSDERQTLKELLTKLEGPVKPSKTEPETTSSIPPAMTLHRAAVSDIGRASGQPPPPSSSNDPHLEEGESEYPEHPFANRFGNHFFFSSAAGSSTGPSNPFFGMQRDFDEDEEHVQCRQM